MLFAVAARHPERSHEEGVARRHGWDADLLFGKIDDRVAGDDLLHQRHGSFRRGDGGGSHLPCHSPLRVLEEATRLDDRGPDGVFPLGKLCQGDGLSGADPRYQPEVCRGEQPDVLAVLTVDLLDIATSQAGCLAIMLDAMEA